MTDRFNVMNVRQMRALSGEMSRIARDAHGRVPEATKRELERLDREALLSSEARDVFQDLLARLGLPTVHPIRLPMNDEPYWFRSGRPLENYQSASGVPASAGVVVIDARIC